MAANALHVSGYRPSDTAAGDGPRTACVTAMSRTNRNQDDDAQPQEDTDRGVVARSPAFELEATDYQTGEGNLLIAEPNKGAAWVECDPEDAVDCKEML